jgi:hypothetical protein
VSGRREPTAEQTMTFASGCPYRRGDILSFGRGMGGEAPSEWIVTAVAHERITVRRSTWIDAVLWTCRRWVRRAREGVLDRWFDLTDRDD